MLARILASIGGIDSATRYCLINFAKGEYNFRAEIIVPNNRLIKLIDDWTRNTAIYDDIVSSTNPNSVPCICLINLQQSVDVPIL